MEIFSNKAYVTVVKAIYVLLLVLGIFVVIINSAQAENGKEIYNNNCLVCHGKNLHGDMPGVPDLVINRAWSMKLDDQIHKFIKEGTEVTGNAVVMPSNGGNPNLTAEEISLAVEYMRKIIKKAYKKLIVKHL